MPSHRIVRYEPTRWLFGQIPRSNASAIRPVNPAISTATYMLGSPLPYDSHNYDPDLQDQGETSSKGSRSQRPDEPRPTGGENRHSLRVWFRKLFVRSPDLPIELHRTDAEVTVLSSPVTGVSLAPLPLRAASDRSAPELTTSRPFFPSRVLESYRSGQLDTAARVLS